ncbi:MAG: DUF3179 domain-containing protein [Chloroflexi bacterium]|nr:DUF3179 domain-containing protein [Chloroflexota bacterium]
MPRNMPLILGIALVALLILAACGAPPDNAGESLNDVASQTQPAESSVEQEPPTATPEPEPEYKIVTLLPRDAIPAIFDPQFLSADEADQEYTPTELVLGVEIDGEARAYSIPFLSSHEIVNDTVGGVPIAATW